MIIKVNNLERDLRADIHVDSWLDLLAYIILLKKLIYSNKFNICLKLHVLTWKVGLPAYTLQQYDSD